MSARERLQSLSQIARNLQTRYGALEEKGERARRAIQQEQGAAISALAALYLRTLDPGELGRAAQLTGFRGFERRDPLKAREREQKVLEQRIAEIRADPRYLSRLEKAGPNGELTELLATAQRELAPHEANCARFESLDTFLELIATRYDTPEFSVGWWRADYWRLWAAGDRVCRALGMDDFGDHVLPAYRQVAAPRDYWRAEVQRLSAELDSIHELVRGHDEAVARLANLDTIYLDQAREYLGEHLASADLGLLFDWAKRVPAGGDEIMAGLRRLAGIQAKLGYVDEILQRGVAPLRADLHKRTEKYSRKLNKITRGKYLAPAEYADTLDQKVTALDAQAQKTERRLDQLVRARNYDSFDYGWDHHLWWWHFTGAPPVRLAPGLHGWYAQHPQLVPARPTDLDPDVALGAGPGDAPDDAAAAFMSGRDGERGGYLS